MNPIHLFSWLGRRDRRPEFSLPVPVVHRAVLFEPLFRRTSRTPYLDPAAPELGRQISRHHPAVLAGHLSTLLAVRPRLDELPTHAIAVFTLEGASCLSDSDRDALWQAYPVPAFEQVITPAGRLVAWECEAHDGLHLAEGAHLPLWSLTEKRECACGQPGERMLNPRLAPALTAGVWGDAQLSRELLASAARSGSN